MKTISINLIITLLLLQYHAFSNLNNLLTNPNSTKGGYNINIKIKGLKDSVCYLGNYYGDKQYIKDTAKINSKGECLFVGKEELPKGIYLVITVDKKYFEIIINNEQNFSIETDSTDFVGNMKIKGSPENKLFYDYLKFIADKQKEVNPLSKKIKSFKDNKDSVKILQGKISKIDSLVNKYKLNLIKQNPETFVAKIFIASKEPEIPATPTLPGGKKDSTFPYRYYKIHYFDNIDFTDDRILRTPIFHNKINEYMTKFISPVPDSIIKESKMLIEKARPNKEMFKYLVWYFTRTYELSNIMGYDKIFVELGKKYYTPEEAIWAPKSTIDAIQKRVNELEPLLLGKKAPNLIMLDTNLSPVSMWDIKAKISILLFWDTECGHCLKEVPKLIKFYDEKKLEFNMELYAIATDTSLVKWKKFIKKEKLIWINVNGPRAYTKNFHELYDINSTPVIYILNDKKEIIAKKLGSEQIEGFIKNYLKKK